MDDLELLRAHGIEVRGEGASREVFEPATRMLSDGTVISASSWVPMPATREELLAWLGY